MSKYRFTDREKWSDKWFRKLSIEEKVLFEYLRDVCDNAGFYEIDMEIIPIYTKLSEQQILGAIKGLNRAYIVHGGILWLKNFLKHQKNLPLNIKNNAHKEIINIIQSYLSVFPEVPTILGADKGLFSPPGKGNGTSNGKGKVKERNKIPPSYQEVDDYIKKNNYPVNSQKWYDHYTSNNWMVGKNKMKDWQAAVRTWLPDKKDEPEHLHPSHIKIK